MFALSVVSCGRFACVCWGTREPLAAGGATAATIECAYTCAQSELGAPPGRGRFYTLAQHPPAPWLLVRFRVFARVVASFPGVSSLPGDRGQRNRLTHTLQESKDHVSLAAPASSSSPSRLATAAATAFLSRPNRMSMSRICPAASPTPPFS